MDVRLKSIRQLFEQQLDTTKIQ